MYRYKVQWSNHLHFCWDNHWEYVGMSPYYTYRTPHDVIVTRTLERNSQSKTCERYGTVD